MWTVVRLLSTNLTPSHVKLLKMTNNKIEWVQVFKEFFVGLGTSVLFTKPIQTFWPKSDRGCLGKQCHDVIFLDWASGKWWFWTTSTFSKTPYHMHTLKSIVLRVSMTTKDIESWGYRVSELYVLGNEIYCNCLLFSWDIGIFPDCSTQALVVVTFCFGTCTNRF